MGRVIPFYVPENFVSKGKGELRSGIGEVIEFAPAEPTTRLVKSTEYFQPTWLFPEVDADLVVGQD